MFYQLLKRVKRCLRKNDGKMGDDGCFPVPVVEAPKHQNRYKNHPKYNNVAKQSSRKNYLAEMLAGVTLHLRAAKPPKAP